MKTFQIDSLSNFQVYSTVLLTVIIMLYIYPSAHSSYNWKFLPSGEYPPISFTLSLWQLSLYYVSMSLTFLDSTYKCNQTVVFLSLPNFTYVMASRFICVIANNRNSFSFFMTFRCAHICTHYIFYFLMFIFYLSVCLVAPGLSWGSRDLRSSLRPEGSVVEAYEIFQLWHVGI